MPSTAHATNPSVAVLLSTYNGAAYLPEQLDSLAAQQGVTVRLHVRDDGSSDSTLEVLRGYARHWPSLANIRSGPNLGAAGSFLELLRTAPDDADFYAFCDQDDVWLPRKLARAAEALGGDERPALYCSNLTCVAEDLTPLGVPAPNGDPRLEHLIFENIATGCTVVMNAAARDLVNARLPQRGVVMHDWWCALVVAANCGRVHYDPEPSLLYRQHGANSVGSSASRLGQTLRNAARFIRAPQSFYRIHAQAEELLRIHGERMAPDAARVVRALVNSRRSVMERARYALSGAVLRQRCADMLIVRLLIAAGRY